MDKAEDTQDEKYNKAKSDFLEKINADKNLNPLELLKINPLGYLKINPEERKPLDEPHYKVKIFQELLNSNIDLILRSYVEPLSLLQTGLSWLGLKPNVKYDFSKPDSEGITVFDYIGSSLNMAMTFFDKSKDLDLNLNLKMQDGLPLLLHAAKNKKFNLLKVLIDKGADLSITDNKSENVLHKLIREFDNLKDEGKLEILDSKVKPILDSIHTVNPLLFNKFLEQDDINAHTPLKNVKGKDIGIYLEEYRDIYKQYLNCKEKAKTYDANGINPLLVISNVEKNAGKVLEYFLKNDLDLILKEFKREKINENFSDLNKIYDPNQLDKKGESLLEQLISSEQTLKVIFNNFDEKNIDINIKNKNGKTPLMKAAEYGYKDSIIYLNEQPDIDWKIKDNNDQNIMHKIAAQFKDRDKEGQLEAIKLLSQNNLLAEQLDHKDEHGKEPYKYLLQDVLGISDNEPKKMKIDPNKKELVDILEKLKPGFKAEIKTYLTSLNKEVANIIEAKGDKSTGNTAKKSQVETLKNESNKKTLSTHTHSR